MSTDQPKKLEFRSDIRTKVDLDDLMRLYHGLILDPVLANKTPNMGGAVLARIDGGCRLHFPGHILNACEYHLISSVWRIALPSRVPHWLFDKGYLNAYGEITKLGTDILADAHVV